MFLIIERGKDGKAGDTEKLPPLTENFRDIPPGPPQRDYSSKFELTICQGFLIDHETHSKIVLIWLLPWASAHISE